MGKEKTSGALMQYAAPLCSWRRFNIFPTATVINLENQEIITLASANAAQEERCSCWVFGK